MGINDSWIDALKQDLKTQRLMVTKLFKLKPDDLKRLEKIRVDNQKWLQRTPQIACKWDTTFLLSIIYKEKHATRGRAI